MAINVPCPSVPEDWPDRPGLSIPEHPRSPCRVIRPQIIHLCAAVSDDRRALTTVHIGGSECALCGQRLVTERDRPTESPPSRSRGLPIMRFGGGPPGIWLGRSRTTSSGTVNALSCTSMRSANSRASPASRLSRRRRSRAACSPKFTAGAEPMRIAARG